MKKNRDDCSKHIAVEQLQGNERATSQGLYEASIYNKPEIQASSLSQIWLDRLVQIDSSWNPKAWSIKLFEGELGNPTSRVRGVFSGECLEGYLIAHVVLDSAHIVSFGLAPQSRRKGLGSYLLKDFLRLADIENIRVVTLDVRVSNTAARALYSKFGFVDVGVRRKYYSDNSEDAITMRRQVIPE